MITIPITELVKHVSESNLAPYDKVQLTRLAGAAAAMVTKMSALKWGDRHLGFDEWRALSDAIEGRDI